MLVGVNDSSDKIFVNEMEVMSAQDYHGIEEYKNESIPMHKTISAPRKKVSLTICKDCIGNKEGSIPVSGDCIGNKKESIHMRKDCIGNIKMSTPERKDCIGDKLCIPVSEDCICNKKEIDQCELKKVTKLKQEEFEQGRVLEHRKDAQIPLAVVYNVHDSVSLGSEENSNA